MMKSDRALKRTSKFKTPLTRQKKYLRLSTFWAKPLSLGHKYFGLTYKYFGLGRNYFGLTYKYFGLGHKYFGLGHNYFGLGRKYFVLSHNYFGLVVKYFHFEIYNFFLRGNYAEI